MYNPRFHSGHSRIEDGLGPLHMTAYEEVRGKYRLEVFLIDRGPVTSWYSYSIEDTEEDGKMRLLVDIGNCGRLKATDLEGAKKEALVRFASFMEKVCI